ncbi:hypothetical protein [Novosphingobium album (ex Hu et al. 2023)]|uniref:Uncharacterized protein n=1 Tax=Novosphingobium album (ex Hu et al. 2023) TaxID=2930093 RepID=A0ABT0B7S0_9SPHN|nr:hypothetical protein [Novosphingobium album (ex Hu et al. 2023)]MCJ2181084.1 hypothetical protein [Novosphingobium album (ex Hu et al. 2023)]
MALKSSRRSVPKSRVEASEKQRPISPKLFSIIAALTLVYLGVIFWISIGDTPLETFGIEGPAGVAVGNLPRLFLIGLAVLFLVTALATSEIIPPKGAWTWNHLRRPKVLAQIAFQMLSAAGFVAGIATIFDKSSDQIIAITTDNGKKVEDLKDWLKAKFPDDPPILEDIGGQWGDLEPACEVVWKIGIIRRGDDASLVAETVKTPAGVEPYRFLGSIIKAEGGTLYVEGVEPVDAVGSNAHFTFNAATQRLSWDDRARGSGGVEIFQRCG